MLRNTSPGRDLVLARLSGLGLEKTGVIAGMSGSPVYLDGKLLGAVAYAWAFGKEPIAGITPFAQMPDFVGFDELLDPVNMRPIAVRYRHLGAQQPEESQTTPRPGLFAWRRARATSWPGWGTGGC